MCTCLNTDKDNLVAKECNLDVSNCGADCDTSACGVFTTWSEWSTCTVTCGGGTKTRDRCFEPANDSADQCETENADCNETACPAWASWRPWSTCS